MDCFKIGVHKPDLQSDELVAKRTNADRVKLFAKARKPVSLPHQLQALPKFRNLAQEADC